MVFLRALLFAGVAALPAPVLALSCAPTPPERAFQQAQASRDAYIVAVGQLDFNPDDLPVVTDPAVEQPAHDNVFRATLTGFFLTGSGFDARFVRQIRVNAQCIGPFCAALAPGQQYLAFLRQEGQGYVLEQSPCGGLGYPKPSDALLERMHQCLLGEECVAPDRE